MRTLSLLGSMVVAWAVLATPALARACAVCTAGKDEENAFAFLMTTIFMSIMPLAAIGTLVFVLYRRMRKLEAESEARDALRKRRPTPRPARRVGSGSRAARPARRSASSLPRACGARARGP